MPARAALPGGSNRWAAVDGKGDEDEDKPLVWAAQVEASSAAAAGGARAASDAAGAGTGARAPPPAPQLVWHLVLAFVQILFSGMHIACAPALRAGMHPLVLAAYRELMAVPPIAAAALTLESGGHRPPLTGPLLAWMALMGLIGVAGVRIFVFLCLYYSGPDVTASLTPLTPTIAMALSIALGLEGLPLHRWTGYAKAGGLLLCCVGAAVMGTLPGPPLTPAGGPGLLRGALASLGAPQPEAAKPLNLPLGVLSMLGNCASFATYSLLQKRIMAQFSYPPISTTAWVLTFGAAFESLLALATVPLGRFGDVAGGAGVLAVVYSGLVPSALCYLLIAMASRHVDATVVTVYIPLQPIATTCLSFLLLGDDLLAGNLAGGAVIIIGVLLVLSAKRAEALAGPEHWHRPGPGPPCNGDTATALKRSVSVFFSSLQLPDMRPSEARRGGSLRGSERGLSKASGGTAGAPGRRSNDSTRSSDRHGDSDGGREVDPEQWGRGAEEDEAGQGSALQPHTAHSRGETEMVPAAERWR